MIEIKKFHYNQLKWIFPIFLFCLYFSQLKGPLSPQSQIGEKKTLIGINIKVYIRAPNLLGNQTKQTFFQIKVIFSNILRIKL